jgi:hypothetical protein
MAQLATDGPGQIQIKKMPLTKNGLQIASEKIEDQHVCQQMPRPVVQKHSGNELPRVCVVNAATA